MEPFSSQRLMILAEHLYRVLLFAYPAQFRRTYRREMIQTFRACCREARQDGPWGMLRLWSLVLSDLVTSACTEHIRTYIATLKRLFLNTTDTLFTTEGTTAMVTQFHLNA